CTPGFYYEFIKGLNRIHEDENVKRIPSNLPIFLIAGSDDPVGSYGKGVIKKYNQYKKLNKKVNIKLYEGMRHEILNEIGREEVYNDVLNFYNE
ncbi:MAG: alpha/beta hydrolase, partial [Bacilli bacterium]|nr:alpha/beta hydrolase [Bacilli bacterium]